MPDPQTTLGIVAGIIVIVFAVCVVRLGFGK